MKPTEVLSNEHVLIKQVLTSLEEYSLRISSGTQKLDCNLALSIVDFFRSFADKYHHEKEENCLFGLMEKRGIPKQGGPIEVMLHEHEEGRMLVRGMLKAINDAKNGIKESQDNFVTSAKQFIQLLRDHIEKEDHCLFPMIDQALTNDDQIKVSKEFADIETSQFPGAYEKYTLFATTLADQLKVQAK